MIVAVKVLKARVQQVECNELSVTHCSEILAMHTWLRINFKTLNAYMCGIGKGIVAE